MKNSKTAPKFWNLILDGEEEASLDIYGEITESHPTDWWTGEPVDGLFCTPKAFTDDLNRCKNAKEITVKINSGGGDLYLGMAIYNTLKNHPAKIKVVIDGIAASAASIIACAGDTVQVHGGSVIMIHNALGQLFGYYNATDLAKVINGLKAADNAIAAVYAEKTGKDEGTLKGMMTRETWLTGAEAVENGFADELVTYGDADLKIAASANGKRALICNGVKVISDFTPPANAAALGMTETEETTETTEKEANEMETENKHETTPEATPAETPEANNAAAIAAAVEAALTEERERLKAIDEISAGVDPALVARAKYGDGEEKPMTAAAFALHVMRTQAKQTKNGGAAFLTARAMELEESGANKITPQPVGSDEPRQGINLDALAAKAKAFNATR